MIGKFDKLLKNKQEFLFLNFKNSNHKQK